METNIDYEVVHQFETDGCVFILKQPKESFDKEYDDYHRYIADLLYGNYKKKSRAH